MSATAPATTGLVLADDVPATMRASVLLRQGEVEMQERPVPTPPPGEVLVRGRLRLRRALLQGGADR